MATWRSIRSDSVSMPCSSMNALVGGQRRAVVERRDAAQVGQEGASGRSGRRTRRRPGRSGSRCCGKRDACDAQSKRAGVDDDAADDGAVTGQPLRGGVDHEVGAVLDRPVEVRRRDGVVDDERERRPRARCRARRSRSTTSFFGFGIVSVKSALVVGRIARCQTSSGASAAVSSISTPWRREAVARRGCGCPRRGWRSRGRGRPTTARALSVDGDRRRCRSR